MFIKEYNKLIKDCIYQSTSPSTSTNINNSKFYYTNEDEYIKSIQDEVKSFSKILTKTIKNNIDTIVYNSKQNDGTISAAIVYHYITQNKNTQQIQLFRIGEGYQKLKMILNKLQNKNIIILDLEYNKSTYQELENICKSVITIDDHAGTDGGKYTFHAINKHATCAYTWYIFYPKEKIPKVVQYIDTNDSKKWASFLPESNLVATFLGYRVNDNPYIKKYDWENGTALTHLWNLIDDDNHINLMKIVGIYLNELQENLKEQIAKNAVVRNFQGYKVVILNYSDPALTKRIGRQMITNMNKQGAQIDFAVLWAFEYNKNVFRIQIIDDHKQTKYNLGEIAKKLGSIGGTKLGGGGHMHVGNFYWSKQKGLKDLI